MSIAFVAAESLHDSMGAFPQRVIESYVVCVNAPFLLYKFIVVGKFLVYLFFHYSVVDSIQNLKENILFICIRLLKNNNFLTVTNCHLDTMKQNTVTRQEAAINVREE